MKTAFQMAVEQVQSMEQQKTKKADVESYLALNNEFKKTTDRLKREICRLKRKLAKDKATKK